MNFLFLFLDGVGLGKDNPEINPFCRANMPNLQGLFNGRRMLAGITPVHSERATLLALDANLGVSGLPQSATGQATLLTGRNVPAELGYHYGPKPNPPVAEIVQNGNIFNILSRTGRKAALLNAYPPRYFDGITSGRRLYSAIPLAVTSAGIPLKNIIDLAAGQALSADFTGQGLRDHLGLSEVTVLDPFAAGLRLAKLAQAYDFAFFEYWLSDYAGHHQDIVDAITVLETFDVVLGGLLAGWDDASGLVFFTSDHGNMEDLSTRRHTANPVPGLLIGAEALREKMVAKLKLHAQPESNDGVNFSSDLAQVAPAILHCINDTN
jgi:hypothetical protein